MLLSKINRVVIGCAGAALSAALITQPIVQAAVAEGGAVAGVGDITSTVMTTTTPALSSTAQNTETAAPTSSPAPMATQAPETISASAEQEESLTVTDSDIAMMLRVLLGAGVFSILSCSVIVISRIVSDKKKLAQSPFID